MFDSMLKPGWQHPDIATRRAAVAELDDQSILVEVVKTDPDEDIRARALALITDPEALDALLHELAPTLRKQASAQRLKQILPDRESLAAIGDDEVLLRIASLADDGNLRLEAVDRLSNADVRYEVAINHPVAKVRLSAAKGIQDVEKLQRLMEATQGKDKAIYRHCKDQVNIHKAALSEAEECQKTVESLIEKAKNLSSSLDSPEYAGSFRLLQRQWQGVEAYASKGQCDQIQLYLKTCAARVADKAAAQATVMEREAASTRAEEAYREVLEEAGRLHKTFAVLDRKPEISRLVDTLSGFEAKWQEASGHARPAKDQANEFEKLMEAWRQACSVSVAVIETQSRLKKLASDVKQADKSDFIVLEQLQRRANQMSAGFSWPDLPNVERPESMVQLDELQSRVTARLELLSREQEKNVGRVTDAMTSLVNDVDEGHMKDASRSLLRVRRALKTLPQNRQRRYEKELKPLLAQLEEIRDWQGFAIEPKKLELCEGMEALADSKQGAEQLAGQIHDLQEQWKQFGPLEPRRDQELWKRFSAAADKAYEPCKAEFKRQAAVRRANLARRLEVVEELKRYEEGVDWEQAESAGFDWKDVTRQLSDTRARLRAIKPVGHAGAARSESALKKVSDSIYAHVGKEYDRNIQAKEDLIGRARKLAEVENLDQAIEQAKRLQVLWKGMGITPAKVDRSQWKKFRSACDAVFRRLDDKKQQHRAEIDAVVDQAEGLVKQAEELLRSDEDGQRLHVEESLREIQQAIGALELPRGAEQRLGKRLGEVEKRAKQVASDTRKRLRESQWELLYDKIRACALKEDDVGAASGLWEQAGDMPRGVDEAALLAWWEQGTADEEVDVLREICIAVEVLADIESPESDAPARMAFQVKRLADGMGKQREAPLAALVRLVNEIVASRPESGWADRFCAAAKQLGAVVK